MSEKDSGYKRQLLNHILQCCLHVKASDVELAGCVEVRYNSAAVAAVRARSADL